MLGLATVKSLMASSTESGRKARLICQGLPEGNFFELVLFFDHSILSESFAWMSRCVTDDSWIFINRLRD